MLLRPQALKQGDCLGIFAPASPVRREFVEKGHDYLLRSGYSYRDAGALYARDYHVAGDLNSRLTDFADLLVDPDVKGLIAARGGYGSMTLLPHLDYARISSHPKIILGFSDITALQLALWHKIELITFSGPMLASEMARAGSVNSSLLWALLTGADAELINSLLSAGFQSQNIEFLRPGTFSGRLLGGTLTIVAALAGSIYMPDFNRKIIILEDRGEPLYRIDRALSQLRLSGVFKNPAAVVCGDFSMPDNRDETLRLKTFLREFFADDDFPVLLNFPYGHIPQSFIFPQGSRMQFECRERKISLLEAPVTAR